MSPIDLIRYVNIKNNVLGFTIKIQGGLEALTQLLNIIHESNASIVSTSISANRGTFTIHAILDLGRLRTSLEDLLSLMGRLPAADVRVFRDFEGIAFDTEHFPLMTCNERAIVLPQHIFEGIVSGVRSRMGSGGDAVLYHVGYMSGCEVSRHYIEKLNLRDALKLFKFLKLIMMSLGWGIVEDYDVNIKDSTARLRVRGLWECSLYGGLRDPQSHFFRGFLAGFSSTIFSVEMKAKEVKCIGMGDNYCEFIVRRGSI